MKNNYNIRIRKAAWIMIFVIALFGTQTMKAQTSAEAKKSIAVINIDSKGLLIKMPLLTSLVTLELERLNIYEVIDKYDVANHMKKNKIATDQAYGKTDLIHIGSLLKVDKVLSGSAEKFGIKIIVVLRLIDVNTKKIEKVDVMEYIDQEEDIQEMVKISLHNILGIDSDKNTVEMLTSNKSPIANTKNRVNLSGPRFGATMTFGNSGKRLQAPKDQGGFDMFPLSSTFGYQWEKQYIGSGHFQALLEVIGSLNALESGYMIPSLSVMTGFRFNKIGLEFGLGPVFRAVKTAEGYFDADGAWNLRDEYSPADANFSYQIDNRGTAKLSTGLIIAMGFTIKKGQINFPINVYCSPRKEGTVVGLVFGFNVASKKKNLK